MEPQNPFTIAQKGKQSDSGFTTFVKDSGEAILSDHPGLNNLSSNQLLSAKYSQLSPQDKQIYASKGASQNQIQTIQKKKKKPLAKSGDGSPNSTPYISQSSTTNYSQQEPQHFPNLHSVKISQFNQQSSHPKISNNQRQCANSNYQTISTIQPKQIQQVTPKKHITKPIVKKEQEYSDSYDESDSTYTSSNQASLIKMSSINQKLAQSQSQVLQSNYYFNQPQIKSNYSSQQQQSTQQQQQQQKLTKPAAVLPTTCQQSQSVTTQDHRIQYDQNESKRYINVNLNTKSGQAPSSNDPYYALQQNQIDPKYYDEIEAMLEDEISDSDREKTARGLLNEFELKSSFCFSLTPFDCNCLENYPAFFNG